MWGRSEPEGSMRSVMTIYGTRPEAIKMAPLIAALRAHPSLRPIVALTGQHREMLDQVNALFDIVPDFDMDLMSKGATLTSSSFRATPPAPSLLRSLPSTTTSLSCIWKRACGPATSTHRSRRRSTAGSRRPSRHCTLRRPQHHGPTSRPRESTRPASP